MKKPIAPLLTLLLLGALGCVCALPGCSSSDDSTGPSATAGGEADSGGGQGDEAGEGIAGGGQGGEAGEGIAGGGRGISACDSPKFDSVDELFVCANGIKHRAAAVACSSASSSFGHARGDGFAGAGGAGGAGGDGALRPDILGPCTKDGDCNAGEACLCNAAYFDTVLSGGACVPATCRIDADCGAGSWCAIGNELYLGEAITGLGCLSPADECTTNADCHSMTLPLCLDRPGGRVCTGLPE